MKRLLLASTSPRRREILEKIGVEFEVIGCDYEEDMTLDMPAEELAEFLAKGKAESVDADDNNAIILSADTIVVHEGQVLGKPKTPERAQEMLKMLSGTRHQVMTGYAIRDIESGKCVSGVSIAYVEFEELSDEMIDAYVATGEPLDKAGAYAIQEKGAVIIKGVFGDYMGIIGLPVVPITKALSEFGIKPFTA